MNKETFDRMFNNGLASYAAHAHDENRQLRADLAAAHADVARAHEREAQLLEVMWRWAEFSLCSTTRQALRKACEAHPSHDKSWAAATPPATEGQE